MVRFFQTSAPGTLLMPGIGAMGYAVPVAIASIFADMDIARIAEAVSCKGIRG